MTGFEGGVDYFATETGDVGTGVNFVAETDYKVEVV